MKIDKIKEAKTLFDNLDNVERVLGKLNEINKLISENDGDYWNVLSKHQDGSGWNVILNGVVPASDMVEFALNKADQKKREIESEIEKL